MGSPKKLIHYYVLEDGELFYNAGEHDGPKRECVICPQITKEIALMELILEDERQAQALEDAKKPIKHDWEKDESGNIVIHYHGENNDHGGPWCSRCYVSFCKWCEPERMDEPCEEQTENLF